MGAIRKRFYKVVEKLTFEREGQLEGRKVALIVTGEVALVY